MLIERQRRKDYFKCYITYCVHYTTRLEAPNILSVASFSLFTNWHFVHLWFVCVSTVCLVSYIGCFTGACFRRINKSKKERKKELRHGFLFSCHFHNSLKKNHFIHQKSKPIMKATFQVALCGSGGQPAGLLPLPFLLLLSSCPSRLPLAPHPHSPPPPQQPLRPSESESLPPPL